MHGYREGRIKNPFEPVNITQNNIDVATIIVYCVQVLNVILLIFALKKSKYAKLIIATVGIILVISCFIPVKYESSYTMELDYFNIGFKEPIYVDKYKNIYSITLKTNEYTK